MTEYQKFLNNIRIISEDTFNDIIASLPKCSIDDVDFSDYSYYNDPQDYIAECIINKILTSWNYVYTDAVDFENKTFKLYDLESLEDLEKIKNIFKGWTISNYNHIINSTKESEEFNSLIEEIRLKADVVQLKEFIKTL